MCVSDIGGFDQQAEGNSEATMCLVATSGAVILLQPG